MYYNPSTKEILSSQDLKNLLNASFPETTEEVQGWFLIDKTSKYPSLEPDQYATEDSIQEFNGKYVQTYAVHTRPAASSSSLTPTDESDRVALLEKAVKDLAQMISNLEEYRVWKERQEAGETDPENEPKEGE